MKIFALSFDLFKPDRRFALAMLLVILASRSLLAQNAGYWEGVERNLATTRFGNVAAIAAHNCYVDAKNSSFQNLKLTLDKIHAAQNLGADLIELDIKLDRGKILVAHDDDSNSNRAMLSDVLADEELKRGNQVLFIEIKEKTPTAEFALELLKIVDRAKVVRPGRPIVFRAFDDRRQNLLLIKSALTLDAVKHLSKYTRLHEFIRRDKQKSSSAFHEKIQRAKLSGFHGVEFRYDAADVFGGISYAKSLGLGVGLFTFPVKFGEVFVAGFREDVDALVVDYPVDKSRKVVEAKNGIFFLNSRNIKVDASVIDYSQGQKKNSQIQMNSASSPSVQRNGVGSAMFGASLGFSGKQFVTMQKAELAKEEGYFVTASVVFNQLKIGDGETQTILANSDTGGFALELHNPRGLAPTILRYGVFVGERYYYAAVPAKSLSEVSSHFIIGAYDGDGGVRLWIDGKDNAVRVANAVGGVGKVETPIVIGADPQGKIERRFFFNGEIQQVQVQSWREH